MLEILMMPLGPLQTNCYLAGCTETMDAAIVDPAWDGPRIAAAADERGWQITHILLTHAHFDHIGGLAALKEETAAPVYLHRDAEEMLQQAPHAASRWGLQVAPPPTPDHYLEEGQELQIGQLRSDVLYTPGHAPGHVSFHFPAEQALFDGDVLFQRSIGRTDLPGADYETLLKTIREKLLVLPDETRVFSGHGAPTTIGEERQLNPFL
ncbi:MAG: MBL fold metallo-hydrolase [Candidatus Promineifilaceae bacterium]|nr:MBL fold metallo-hydrolase [Candidatus Promineifilaceae bacterium]